MNPIWCEHISWFPDSTTGFNWLAKFSAYMWRQIEEINYCPYCGTKRPELNPREERENVDQSNC